MGTQSAIGMFEDVLVIKFGDDVYVGKILSTDYISVYFGLPTTETTL